MSTDQFEPGQWFHGRIYEKRCDLSPDGSLLVYFASKFPGGGGYTHAWTAVSKPTYLTALALWPKGDCWHGGGLFDDERLLWLNHKPDSAEFHPAHSPRGNLLVKVNETAAGEDYPIESRRWARDGWTMQQPWKGQYRMMPGFKTDEPEIWHKSSPDGSLVLAMQWSLREYVESRAFWLIDRARDELIEVTGAEWADWDQRGRLVYFRQGKLYTRQSFTETRLLADFDSMSPEPIESPEWAQRW